LQPEFIKIHRVVAKTSYLQILL